MSIVLAIYMYMKRTMALQSLKWICRGMPYREEEPSHLKLIKDNWQGDVLHGVNPIISALKAERRSFYKLYIQEGAFQHDLDIGLS